MKNNTSLSATETEELHRKIIKDYGSVLHWLVIRNDINTLKFVHQNNPTLIIDNFDVKQGTGYTPWHLAVVCGHLDILKILYLYQSNIDVTTEAGQSHVKVSALYLAILQKEAEIFDWLIKQKANCLNLHPHIQPIHFAADLMFPHAVKVFLQKGEILDEEFLNYIKTTQIETKHEIFRKKIVAIMSYFLRLRSSEKYTYYIQIDYAQKFWNNGDYAELNENNITETTNKVPPNTLSLKQLTLVKICFFKHNKHLTIETNKLPLELQEEYFDFESSWLNNTLSRQQFLVNYYYSEIKKKFTALLNKTHKDSFPQILRQAIEIVYCQAGNLLKQVNAIYRDSKLTASEKLQYFLQSIRSVGKYFYDKKHLQGMNLTAESSLLMEKILCQDKLDVAFKALINIMEKIIENPAIIAPEINSSTSNCPLM